jgi:integrative and conjugative element protein (TIGR02256 family)
LTTVWLDPNARRKIAREAKRFRFLETGGPLFGFGDEDALVVVTAAGPGPRARHRPMSFVPDRDAVERAIDRVWELGERRYRYLGSWHTHPRGRAAPSRRDRLTAGEMSEDAGLSLPRPLILIQSTWPGRRIVRDRDLRAHYYDPLRADLVPALVRAITGAEREWDPIELD